MIEYLKSKSESALNKLREIQSITAEREIKEEADKIIGDIYKICDNIASYGGRRATVMYLQYKCKYHHFHYMHTGLLSQRHYNLNSSILNGLRPEHLKNAAKLVFEWCKKEGLNPSVIYGENCSWQIIVSW